MERIYFVLPLLLANITGSQSALGHEIPAEKNDYSPLLSQSAATPKPPSDVLKIRFNSISEEHYFQTQSFTGGAIITGELIYEYHKEKGNLLSKELIIKINNKPVLNGYIQGNNRGHIASTWQGHLIESTCIGLDRWLESTCPVHINHERVAILTF